MIDIVLIFGESEVGNCSVDKEAVARYCLSNRYIVDMWGVTTEEEIYNKITDDILHGMPVWQFLKISDWSKEMLDKSFSEEAEAEYEALKKKYKCYTCEHHKIQQTSFGIIEKCIRPRGWNKRRAFEPKRSCKYYNPVRTGNLRF